MQRNMENREPGSYTMNEERFKAIYSTLKDVGVSDEEIGAFVQFYDEGMTKLQNKETARMCSMCKINPAGQTGVCDECLAKDRQRYEEKLLENANKNPLANTQEKKGGRRVAGKKIEEPSPWNENAVRDMEDSGK